MIGLVVVAWVDAAVVVDTVVVGALVAAVAFVVVVVVVVAAVVAVDAVVVDWLAFSVSFLTGAAAAVVEDALDAVDAVDAADVELDDLVTGLGVVRRAVTGFEETFLIVDGRTVVLTATTGWTSSS